MGRDLTNLNFYRDTQSSVQGNKLQTLTLATLNRLIVYQRF